MIKTVKRIQFVPSPTLSRHGSTVHGFLLRKGGVSGPPFDSLNFDGRDTDPKENIERNRDLLKEAFSIPVEKLVTVNQVHGSSVLHVKDGFAYGAPVEADAIITCLPGIPLGIMTADCLPALLFDPVNKAIGAAHAGWKGTVKAVTLNTINEMNKAFGSRPENLIAALGPCIGPCCYTVGENVVNEFKASFEDTGCFEYAECGIKLDISLANMSQLLFAGVKKENISFSSMCTACNNSLFFSYRKDGGRTGRQLSFIMLKAEP